MENVAVLLALAAAATVGLSIVIDRFILTDVDLSKGTILLTSKWTTLATATVIALLFTVNLSPTPFLLLLFAIHAPLKVVPQYLYFNALEQADASTVSPIVSSQPLLTVIFAFAFLGERLQPIEYFGVALILCGIVALSLTRIEGSITYNKAVPLAILPTVVWAIEAVFLKYILGFTSSLTAFFWTSVTGALIALIPLTYQHVRAELKELITLTSPSKTTYLGISELVGGISGLFTVTAYKLGAASIVSPIYNMNSVFVFLFILILQVTGGQVDSNTSRGQLAKKGIATLTTFAGVVVLSAI